MKLCKDCRWIMSTEDTDLYWLCGHVSAAHVSYSPVSGERQVHRTTALHSRVIGPCNPEAKFWVPPDDATPMGV
jgi:hypothetical protein